MRKTVLFIILFLGIYVQAQVDVENFESGSNGWVNVECAGGLVSNEYKSGINLSEHVYYAKRIPECNDWSGCMISNKVYTGYKYLHAYMYRSNSGVPNLKVSDTNAQDLLPINTIVANQWQDVVWDISDYETAGTEFIFFMVDRTNLTQDAWMLVDEIQLSNDATPRTKVVGGYKEGYSLVWSDEFNGSQLYTDVWNYNIGTNYPDAVEGSYGWGNNELQYYTKDAVSVADGCLVLTATKQYYAGSPCTSGRINTVNNVYFQYGIIEASVKLPKTANGLWPAFWLMGNDHPQIGWPQCGEIDVVEMGSQDAFGGNQTRYFNGACHYGNAWNDMQHTVYSQNAEYSLQDGQFHLFTCIWTADEIRMYYDLDKYPQHTPYLTLSLNDYSYNGAGNYFHKPDFILFNLAVGGDYTGLHAINDITALSGGPASMYVDYVRVYQRGEAGEQFHGVTATGVSNVQSDKVQGTKVIENGVLYLMYNGTIYNVQGQKVE